jgi:hypothetical protein
MRPPLLDHLSAAIPAQSQTGRGAQADRGARIMIGIVLQDGDDADDDFDEDPEENGGFQDPDGDGFDEDDEDDEDEDDDDPETWQVLTSVLERA